MSMTVNTAFVLETYERLMQSFSTTIQALYDGVIAIVAGDSYINGFSSPWPQLLEGKDSSVIALYMPPNEDGFLTLGYYNESLVWCQELKPLPDSALLFQIN